MRLLSAQRTDFAKEGGSKLQLSSKALEWLIKAYLKRVIADADPGVRSSQEDDGARRVDIAIKLCNKALLKLDPWPEADAVHSTGLLLRRSEDLLGEPDTVPVVGDLEWLLEKKDDKLIYYEVKPIFLDNLPLPSPEGSKAVEEEPPVGKDAAPAAVSKTKSATARTERPSTTRARAKAKDASKKAVKPAKTTQKVRKGKEPAVRTRSQKEKEVVKLRKKAEVEVQATRKQPARGKKKNAETTPSKTTEETPAPPPAPTRIQPPRQTKRSASSTEAEQPPPKKRARRRI